MMSVNKLLWVILLSHVCSLWGASLSGGLPTMMPELHYERRWKAQVSESPMRYVSASMQVDGDSVYILNGGDSGNAIVMFDLEGKYEGTYPGWYNWPVDLTLGGDEGKKQPFLSAIGAMDDTGYLHFGMVLYNSSGSFFHGFMEEDTGLARPYGIAMLPGGSKVAVADWQANKTAIIEVKWTEGTVSVSSDHIISVPYPFRIAVSSKSGSQKVDRLVVSSQVCCEEGYDALNVMSIFDGTGKLIKVIKNGNFGTLKTPNAVAVDPYGNILLVDSHQTQANTYIFDCDGNYIGLIGQLGAPIEIVFHQGKVYSLTFARDEEEYYVNVYSYSMLE